MNINCFQYEDLKRCKRFVIFDNHILAFVKGGRGWRVPITEKQFKQCHNKLVYGKKWERTIEW